MSGSNKAPQVDILRSPLGRARGLGAAKAGAHHWWGMRLTSLALIPLTLWFIFSVIHMSGAGREDIVMWMSSPVVLVMMVCLIVATFHHMAAGLQVVIEDYVHEETAKMAAVLAVKAGSVVLALACIVSALRLGL